MRIISGETVDIEISEIDFFDAKNHALNLLFKIFPDANERFEMEVVEKEILYIPSNNEEQIDNQTMFPNEEDEPYIDTFEIEETYTFIFQLMHEGIKVEHHVFTIDIGKYSGKIQYLDLSLPVKEFYLRIPSKPLISYEQAMNIYKNHLEMELLFVQEFTNGEKVYHLSYGPLFPKTIGHVRMIDAISGDTIFVNIGNATMID